MPETVPLSKLSIDEKVNVRKHGRGAEPEFVGSIAAKGIIEPLTVRPNGKGYKITNGGKRFASLEYMRDRNMVAAGVMVTDDYPVPVTIREEDDRAARDTSLMTNIIRAGMHPVDEFEAFVELINGKMTEEDIAARYGLKVKEVRQRLALGQLSPTIRQAWREGKIDAQRAMAYTLAPSHAEQDKYFKKNGTDRWNGEASAIRSHFTAKQRDVGKLVAFVGVENVRKAGIKVEEDLFGTSHRAADPKKVAALAATKIEEECARLVADGWSWAITDDDPEAKNRYLWSRINRAPKATPEEQARIDEIDKLVDAHNHLDDEDWPVEVQAAADERDKLEAAIRSRSYKPAEKTTAGCVVSISSRGTLEIEYGLLKPKEARKQQTVERQKKKKKAAASGVTPDLSGAVAGELNEALTRAAAKAIVGEPELALQLLLTGLMIEYDSPIAIEFSGLDAGKAKPVKPASAIEIVSQMTPAQRLTALATAIGTAFDFTSYNRDHRALRDSAFTAFICNSINPKMMKVALHQAFDGDRYFERVTSDLIVKAIAEAVNADEARKAGKLKKKELVAFAIKNVLPTGWLPPELRTAHYDGPGAKPAEKTAAKKKGKR